MTHRVCWKNQPISFCYHETNIEGSYDLKRCDCVPPLASSIAAIVGTSRCPVTQFHFHTVYLHIASNPINWEFSLHDTLSQPLSTSGVHCMPQMFCLYFWPAGFWVIKVLTTLSLSLINLLEHSRNSGEHLLTFAGLFKRMLKNTQITLCISQGIRKVHGALLPSPGMPPSRNLHMFNCPKVFKPCPEFL